jgi:hypothetical protein
MIGFEDFIDNVNVFEGPELEQDIRDLGLDEGIPPIVEEDVAEDIVDSNLDPAPVDMVPAMIRITLQREADALKHRFNAALHIFAFRYKEAYSNQPQANLVEHMEQEVFEIIDGKLF